MPWWENPARAWWRMNWECRAEVVVLCDWTLLLQQYNYSDTDHPRPLLPQQLSYQQMDIKIDDLLAFCSYYSLARTNATLPHFCPPSTTPQHPKPKKDQPKRLQSHQQQPKKQKIIKPKLQYSNPTPKKNVSPIHREQQEEDPPAKYDISYFMSHMTSQNNGYSGKEKEYWNQYPTKPQSGLQNYQTFGRSRTKTGEYQTFQDKLLRKDPINQNNYYYTNQKNAQQNNQPWWQSQTTRKEGSFLDFNPPRSYYAPPPTFQSITPFQPTFSQLSSSRKNFSPYSSQLSYSPQIRLSKSRTKSQKKKIDRPFYDASKLTIKKDSPREKPHQIKDNRSSLAQSYITVEEVQERRNLVQGSKRETSTTAPPTSTRRPAGLNPSIDLDEELGETISELSHRKAPVAFELKMNG